MRNMIVILLTSLYSIVSLGQDQYFEGIIEFDHIIIPKDSTYDVDYDYDGIGTSSTYLFKNGNLMFQNKNGYFKKSIFSSGNNRSFLFTVQSDTVMTLDGRLNDADLIDYKFEDAKEVILDYECKVLTISLKPKGKEFPLSTRRYYFPKSVNIDGSQFKECYGNFYNLVYGESNSVPLRIEYEWPNRIVRWQAKSITSQEIDSKIFEIEEGTVLQQVN